MEAEAVSVEVEAVSAAEDVAAASVEAAVVAAASVEAADAEADADKIGNIGVSTASIPNPKSRSIGRVDNAALSILQTIYFQLN